MFGYKNNKCELVKAFGNPRLTTPIGDILPIAKFVNDWHPDDYEDWELPDPAYVDGTGSWPYATTITDSAHDSYMAAIQHRVMIGHTLDELVDWATNHCLTLLGTTALDDLSIANIRWECQQQMALYHAPFDKDITPEGYELDFTEYEPPTLQELLDEYSKWQYRYDQLLQEEDRYSPAFDAYAEEMGIIGEQLDFHYPVHECKCPVELWAAHLTEQGIPW